MKRVTLLAVMLILGSIGIYQEGRAQSSQYVSPQILPDGTYVPGFYPDGRNVFFNNPTPRKFTNPYTGQSESRLPYTNTNIDRGLNYYYGETYNMQYNYNFQP